MPNYGVQMQFVSTRSTRNVSKSEKLITPNRTALFISNRLNVNNKEEKKRRREIRKYKKREQKSREQKKRKEKKKD